MTDKTDSASKLSITVQAAQVNGLVRQGLDRTDVADRPTAGAHEDGMRHRLLAHHLHAWQQRTVTDAGRAEQGALALDQVVHTEDARQFRLAPLRAQAGAFLV